MAWEKGNVVDIRSREIVEPDGLKAWSVKSERETPRSREAVIRRVVLDDRRVCRYRTC
jgi:hypothetical protein